VSFSCYKLRDPSILINKHNWGRLVTKYTHLVSFKFLKHKCYYRVIKKTLCTCLLRYKKHAKIQYFKQFQSITVTEYIRNVDRAILNTAFENTVRRVNKYLEIGRGHFEHYM